MLHKIKKLIEDGLGFAPQEVNGFLVLSGILVVALALPLVVKYGFPVNGYTEADQQQDQAVLAQAVAQIQHRADSQATAKRYPSPEPRPETEEGRELALSRFDPNELTVAQWQAIGLRPWLAERIVKYRSKGGRFRRKADLQKIYGFPPAEYQRLAAFIDLPDEYPSSDAKPGDLGSRRDPAPDHQERPPTTYPKPERRPAAQKMDLNLADTAQLNTLRGIGPVLAARIVKFRDGLGGFHHLDQLAEVYGLPPETVAELQKTVFVAEGFVPKTVNVNTADLNLLKGHPYLGYKVAQAVVNYRAQHGPYTSADDLLKASPLLDAAKLAKLRPYLAF
jgi:DNA uptake protein ComE-like DNA-binding protein